MDKELMHLTDKEVEFLRSFVGKEMIGEEGASVLFSDGSVLTVENEIRDDVPFHGRDEDGYADWDNEGGVIRVHGERIYKDIRPVEEISKEKLPVPHIV